jgi:hypothetical protein
VSKRVALMLGLVLVAAAPARAEGEPALARLLAEGDPESMVAWAARFEHGEGVARDPDAAIRLYCRAARGGHAGARYQLGWLYANGRGVERDEPLAGAWFRLAAEQGDAHAERMLRFVGPPPGPVANPPCRLSDGRSADLALLGHHDPRRREIAAWVEQIAPEYGLDPVLVLAVIQAESNFNPLARSPKNAQGLMQLIPATAQRFGVRDVWDPQENLRGGMAYLRWLLDHFEGDLDLALAGYNAGEGAVQRHGGIPPYPETRAYVRQVSRLAGPRAVATGARPG